MCTPTVDSQQTDSDMQCAVGVLQLTVVVDSDFSEAEGSSCHVRSLNDDVAKCLSGLCTVDDCSLAGGH